MPGSAPDCRYRTPVAAQWLPLIFFALSSVIGVWVAYDLRAALAKFLLIWIALAICVAFVLIPEYAQVGSNRRLAILHICLCVIPAIVAIYFLLTNDWSGRIGKLPWLDPVMRWFNGWQAGSIAYRLDSHVAGGVMAALIPLQVAALARLPERQRILIAVPLLVLSASSLLLSGSRSAWLALVVVCVLYGFWRLGSKLMDGRSRPVRIFATVAIIAVGAWVVLVTASRINRFLNRRSDRTEVWSNAVDLASDYPLTGVGLGNIEMAYSSYTLLVHVAYTTHTYNLYLDLWLEQGLVGVVAFLALAGVVLLQPQQSGQWWGVAAGMAIVVILLHGLVDDAFFGYGGLAAPLLLLPFGLRLRPGKHHSVAMTIPTVIHRTWLWASVCGACLAFVIAVSPTIQSAFLANLAALKQTKTELTVYKWPQWPLQDAVRRDRVATLADAVNDYEAALILDAANATANRRLGQIQLALGQYDEGCQHISAAYAANPNQRATRQFLGECYALDNEASKAADIWRTIDSSEGQLAERLSWYAEYLGDRTRANKITQALALIGQN